MRAPSNNRPSFPRYKPPRTELAQADKIRRKVFRSGGEQTRHARRKSPRPWCFVCVMRSSGAKIERD
jgi:hypothetical protein